MGYEAKKDKSVKPEQEDLLKLAKLLDKYAPYDASFALPEVGLHIVKASAVTAEETYAVSQPGICIVAQGAKSVSLSQKAFEYNKDNVIVYAAEVPIGVKITKASPKEPYLCLIIPIDLIKLRELIVKVFPNGAPRCDEMKAIYIGSSQNKIIQSAIRIMELIAAQENADLLVPLVVEEIFIRLLRSPMGAFIAQIAITDSHTQKISKAISWLKNNYTHPVKIDELAKVAGMSVSSFHTHFKTVTSMSPLQFQKTLRLQEARNLMMAEKLDVTHAGLHVGYSSISQFSREYRRFFGVSPAKDISKQKENISIN